MFLAGKAKTQEWKGWRNKKRRGGNAEGRIMESEF